MAVVASLPVQSPLVQRRAALGRKRVQRRPFAVSAAEPANTAVEEKVEKKAEVKAEAKPAAVAPAAAAAKAAAPAPAAEEKKERKASPLQRGGTLQGAAAAGKDASEKFRAAAEGGAAPVGAVVMQIVDGRFRDFRWKEGRWDLELFRGADGQMDWDAVIDAEMARRKLLEDSPIPSINEEPVVFDTSEIPWWAWVKRFHLPEAEKLNGRAAMVGYVMALLVDKLTGAGLLDQQESFLGKLVLHLTVFGVLLIRSNSDIDQIKTLLDEATFYDKQWSATWEGVERPSEAEMEGRA